MLKGCGFLNPGEVISHWYEPTVNNNNLTPTRFVEVARRAFDFCAPRASYRRFFCTVLMPAALKTGCIAGVAYLGFRAILVPSGHYFLMNSLMEYDVPKYLSLKLEKPIKIDLAVGVVGLVGLLCSSVIIVGIGAGAYMAYRSAADYSSGWLSNWRKEEEIAMELESVRVEKER